MFDLLTVVFRDELNVLRVQAQSIDLYCQNIGIQHIFVIVNDDDIIADQIDPAWWGSLREYVTIVKRSSFNTEFVDNGWVSQQALKILGSALSTNNYTVVLDAKTIFLQDLTVENIIDSNNCLRVGTICIPEVFKPSQRIVNDFFNINLTHVIGPGGVPFFFNNNAIKSMIAFIEQKTKTDFAMWFQAHGMLTEFILYSGYMLYIHHTFDKIITESNCHPVNICHSEVNTFDTRLQNIEYKNMLTVSIHRNAWSQLTSDQKQQFVNLLIDHNVSTGRDLL